MSEAKFTQMTNADTEVSCRKKGIVKITHKVKVNQESLFIGQEKIHLVVRDISDAILEVLKKHAEKP